MMDDIPIISIGMPVYNREKSLKNALDSLLAQEFSNFELIISDNASTDGTESICRHYAAMDKRIRYVRTETNKGMLWNFNNVLELSHSEYFMWAADDDKWSTDFISSLLKALEENNDASGAFPPYQLVEEETGNIIEGIWTCDYEDRNTFVRLIKFLWHYRDACIYGLMRRKYMNDIKFIPWAWINAKTPYNIAYPLVLSLLSQGNFLTVGEKPLWFKTVTVSQGHATPFMSNPLLGYLAHIFRKINLFTRSMRYIYLGSKSILVTTLIFPFLLLRVTIDCITPIYAALYIWSSGKKISEFSPHEIWRLGVR